MPHANPQVLSGHLPDQGPSQRPHVAFAPLPDVGHPYADGHLLGIAAILPRAIEANERRAVLRTLALITHLNLGRAGVLKLGRVSTDVSVRGLMPETWTRASRHWASVTPVVLDRFPESVYGTEAREIVAKSCERIGLPRPSAVTVSPLSPVRGVPPSREFRPYEKQRAPRRVHAHVVLEFPDPVAAPV